MTATIEIDDGYVTFRDGTISITVKADTATVYDVEKRIPARKVPVSDKFWEEAADFLSDDAAEQRTPAA